MNKPASGKVLVSILSTSVQIDPPMWYIEYEVKYPGATPVWLVVDEGLEFRRDDRQIELSYARGKMQPNVHVFGYFNPEVEKVLPGARSRQTIEIAWPCPLSDIWNTKREATPLPGEYEVSVRVGYAGTAKPLSAEVGESIEAPVLRWQKVAASPPVRIVIPPYKP